MLFCLIWIWPSPVLFNHIDISDFAVNTKADVRFHVATAEWLPQHIRDKILEKVSLKNTQLEFIVSLRFVTLYAKATWIPFKIPPLWLIQQWSPIVFFYHLRCHADAVQCDKSQTHYILREKLQNPLACLTTMSSMELGMNFLIVKCLEVILLFLSQKKKKSSCFCLLYKRLLVMI